jgi:hypothetical protein
LHERAFHGQQLQQEVSCTIFGAECPKAFSEGCNCASHTAGAFACTGRGPQAHRQPPPLAVRGVQDQPPARAAPRLV